MTAKREKKPDPERTEPNRKGTFYRSKGWGNAAANGHQKKRGGRFGSSVMEALGACQTLLDEQMRRGAARPGGASSRFGNLGDQAERMIRTMSDAVIDMSSMWFDYLGSLGRAVGQDEGGAFEGAEDRGGAPGPAVDVSPADRGRACLDLKPGAHLAALNFQPLLDKDGKACGITAQVAHGGPSGAWLRIEVAAGQPAGRFHALALDAQTGEIGGTLTVEVQEAQ